jgi:hypothetical protein
MSCSELSRLAVLKQEMGVGLAGEERNGKKWLYILGQPRSKATK